MCCLSLGGKGNTSTNFPDSPGTVAGQRLVQCNKKTALIVGFWGSSDRPVVWGSSTRRGGVGGRGVHSLPRKFEAQGKPVLVGTSWPKIAMMSPPFGYVQKMCAEKLVTVLFSVPSSSENQIFVHHAQIAVCIFLAMHAQKWLNMLEPA